MKIFNAERHSQSLQNLAGELERLISKLSKVEQRTSQIHAEFDLAGAPCCAYCWSPELRKLAKQQERRRARVDAINEKIGFKQAELEQNTYLPDYRTLLVGRKVKHQALARRADYLKQLKAERAKTGLSW